MVVIHPTAVVDGGAELAGDVVVGAYAVVHGGVRLGAGVWVDAHAVVGGAPQDLGFRGGRTLVEVGAGTAIREGAIVHRSTDVERPTRIGAGCLIMGQTHLGHDCQVGDGVVITQQAALGGHVSVGDGAVVGGMAAVHQRVRIGARAMVGALAKVTRDVLPFSSVDGNPATHRALNVVGLRRSEVTDADIRALRAAFGQLRTGGEVSGEHVLVQELAEFLQAESARGIAPFARGAAE
ncbi:acyl-[acyl-carrier-protein]--UDP-N-acetylglucosamine O-acyltransferase [Kribbella sandramycini]|uniref:Acyl-[acyl-carrier-protein]--UDP-N-acetylglucosamine O-acyltransferase n=1 Tax=Kribbella sandramycini TaxID=60450 RepID=A0A7Y4KXD8_9ACTN|nr:acyl-[acyl-carrier-protein]--UDP-N-acetylglucosamine O-acyltransferase [Kribbella sandramycini]MBB6569749.1 UDP-N-acetylglucosamine acyltransferase [Kribbella sandramycini]NOL40424.1 acyl-[acyl-carrier-protein]--UDP-N-acetylglucosamine O-acyltransferase [Kribbella sandramycini]